MPSPQSEFQRNQLDDDRCFWNVFLSLEYKGSGLVRQAGRVLCPFSLNFQYSSAVFISDEAQYLSLPPKALTKQSCWLWRHATTKKTLPCLKSKMKTLLFQMSLQIMGKRLNCLQVEILFLLLWEVLLNSSWERLKTILHLAQQSIKRKQTCYMKINVSFMYNVHLIWCMYHYLHSWDAL